MRNVAIVILGLVSFVSTGMRSEARPQSEPSGWIYCFAGRGSGAMKVIYFSRIFGIAKGDDRYAPNYAPKFIDYVLRTYNEDKKEFTGSCSLSETKDAATAEMQDSKKDFNGYRVVDANWP